jgi:hypothetical protein
VVEEEWAEEWEEEWVEEWEAEEWEEAEEVEEVEAEEVAEEAAEEVAVEAEEVAEEAEEAAEEVAEEVEKLKISSIYKMPRIVLLTDEHIIEGMIGMLSLIMVAYIINHTISASRSIILGMAFIISWYFRRIGVNIYRHMKKKYSISISPITYDVT